MRLQNDAAHRVLESCVERASTRARALARNLVASRSALPSERFRIVIGVLLSLHFAGQERWAAGALALAITVGAATKPAAALLLGLSVMTRQTTTWRAGLDELSAVAAALWLLLLPGVQPDRSVARGTRTVAAATPALLALVVFAIYLLGSRAFRTHCPDFRGGPWLIASFCTLPALYLLPLGSWRIVAPLVQVGLHGYAATLTSQWLTHAALGATSLLLYEHARLEAPQYPRDLDASQPQHAFDAPFVATATLILVVAIASLAGGAEADSAGQRARQLLSHLGLFLVRPMGDS